MRLMFAFAFIAALGILLAPVTFGQGKPPTADECKKNPKLPGCEALRK